MTESRSYLPFGSKVVARKEIESVVRAFAFMEKQEGMGRIRKVTFIGSRLGEHIWIDGCLDPQYVFEYWMKYGKGFVGSSGKCSEMTPDQVMKVMSEDQIMQVKSDAFAANYAGASMSAISSLASMLPSGQLQQGGSARRTTCTESSQLQLSSVRSS